MTRSIATLALSALIATAAPALAQDAGPAPEGRCEGRRHHGRFSAERMEHRLERLTERLSLDSAQVALVREIFAAAREEARALPHDGDREARHAARRALFESVFSRIDAVLSDAQRAELARLRAEMEARHEERRARRERRGAPEGI